MKCPSEHLFCSSCIQSWFIKAGKKSCPVDREELTDALLTPARMARNMLDDLEVRCLSTCCNDEESNVNSASTTTIKQEQEQEESESDSACDWKGKMKDFEGHLNTCQYIKIPCPMKSVGCCFTCIRKDMNQHTQDIQEHMCLMVGKITALDRENTVLKKETAILKEKTQQLESKIESMRLGLGAIKGGFRWAARDYVVPNNIASPDFEIGGFKFSMILLTNQPGELKDYVGLYLCLKEGWPATARLFFQIINPEDPSIAARSVMTFRFDKKAQGFGNNKMMTIEKFTSEYLKNKSIICHTEVAIELGENWTASTRL